MVGEGVVKTTCGICNLACGMLIHMKDGKPVKVEGDPKNPANDGALCIRGYSSLELLDNPKRLQYPMKRVGKKGEGKWQRITWDEALKITGEKLLESKSKYGAESVVFIGGAAKIYADRLLMRFANVFGTPNISTMAHTCFMPRVQGAMMTYGFKSTSDYEHPSACIVSWGLNTQISAIGEYNKTIEAVEKGAKLIVIDPVETPLARKAAIWMRLRPSSDLALALGMINVIINEDLHDKGFVEKWTIGFAELKQHVQDYSPEEVEKITWVPAETIKQAARLYATTKPGCIGWGNGVDTCSNNFQTARAISILRSITGNLGVPGGDLEWSDPGIMPKNDPDLLQEAALPPEVRSNRISAGDHLLPAVLYSSPYGVVKAMLESKPYPVRSAFVMGCNPLHTFPESKRAYEALESLDFLAVTDLFMTPTAALADIVLPAASFLETDDIHQCEKKTVVGLVEKVAEVGESWSNFKMWNELAKHTGLKEYFWDDDKQVLDYLLEPAGISFDEFREIGIISGNKEYRKYLRGGGFNTPSRKVELYSARLKDRGFDPLPVYYEPPETYYSDPELAKEYPLVFTNFKSASYHHSSGRQLRSLRENHKEPVTIINSKTAGKLGIQEGDLVFIETKRGKIKQKATLSDSIDPRVVSIDFGWWFPEREEDLFGWAESNINVLTDNSQNYARELGSPHLRGLLCKVYKA